MRLRLTSGYLDAEIIDVSSQEELARALARRTTASPLLPSQIHLWHNNAWWNLTDDLAPFLNWIIETQGVDVAEARRFGEAPLQRPDWLFEAACQMQRLLDATEALPPPA